MDRYQCGKCKYTYESPSIRLCPHPAINKKLGSHICVFCCKVCKFYKNYGTGVVCIYGKGD